MKIFKLNIVGINSFSKKQEINFELLTDRKLFGIFGPTGSGKSTILDCIFLAFYGQTAHKKQAKEFVNARRITAEVELVFGGGDKGDNRVYSVTRHYKLDRATNTVTVTVKLDEIYTDGTKKQIAKSEDEVNEQIIKIIGFSFDEFGKVIAMTQGQTYRLLIDSSYSKNQVFSSLFGLQNFDKSFFDKLVKAEAQTLREVAYCQGALAEIGGEEAAKLDEYKYQLATAKTVAEEIRNKTDYLREELIEKEKQKITKHHLDEAIKKIETLSKNKKEIEKKQRELDIQKASMKLDPAFKHLEGAKEQLKEIENNLKAVDSRISHNTKELAAVAKTIEKENTQKLVRLSNIELQKRQINKYMENKRNAKVLFARASKVRVMLKEANAKLIENENYYAETKKEAEEATSHLQELHNDALSLIAVTNNKSSKQVEFDQETLRTIILQNNKKIAMLESKNKTLESRASEIETQMHGINKELMEVKADIWKYYGSDKTPQESYLACLEDFVELRSAGQNYLTSSRQFAKNQNELEQFEQALVEAKEQVAIHELQITAQDNRLQKLRENSKKNVAMRESFLGQNLTSLLANYQEVGQSCALCDQVITTPLAKQEQISLSAYDFEIESLEHQTREAQAKKEELICKKTQLTQNVLFIKAEINRLSEENTTLKAEIDELVEEHSGFAGVNEENVNKLVELARIATDSLKALIDTFDKTTNELTKRQNALVQTKYKIDTNLEEIAFIKKDNELLAQNFDTSGSALKDAIKQEKQNEASSLVLKNTPQIIFEKLANRERASKEFILALARCEALKQQILNLEGEAQELLVGVDENANYAQTLRELIVEENDIRSSVRLLTVREEDLTRQISSGKIEKANLVAALAFKQNEIKQIEDEVDAVLSVFKISRKEVQLTPKIDSKQVQELEEEIKEFLVQLQVAIAARDNLSAIYKDFKQDDQTIDDAKVLFDDSNEQYIEQLRKVEQLAVKIVELQKVKDKTKYLQSKKDLMTKKLANIKILKDAAMDGKILSFALKEYINCVVEHANGVLATMTNGRYQLMYDDNFIVIDNLNGGAIRNISTLSGGETFIVSLALAIAVVMFVSSMRRKEIEFLFLDEGFGSLDKECLAYVMTALRKLNDSHLMIGIISHEQSVKAKMPRKLEISKADAFEGSTLDLVF